MSHEQGSGPVTEDLAAFIAGSRREDVPDDVRHEARRSLVNFFACALGGCRDAFVNSATHVLTCFGSAGTATVIGRRQSADVLTAAFLNAASANVFDFDDTHPRTIIHPTAPVAAALLAFAESSPLSGRDLLHALVLGMEAECRIGNAVSPEHYRRGWHITSTCGVFGAAVAVSKAIGLPRERIVWALGNASAQAGGLLETLGSMAKSVSVGNAARNGVVAALLAQAGVFGPQRPLEGTYGFLRVFGPEPDAGRVTEGLGHTWEAALNTYKPYPCGIVLSPVLDACLALRSAHQLDADRIARVEITAHPLLRERTDRVHPVSGREAQVSAQHAVAVALTRGKAGLAEFSDACANDAGLRALREGVAFVEDPQRPVESATLTVRLRDGATLEHRVDEPRGSTARPLTDADLESKLRDLVEYGGSQCDAARLAHAIWHIEDADDAAGVVRLAAG
jgi:2-methylcitrate dehydratase PrpD